MKFCFIAKIFLKMTSGWNFFKWGNFEFARFLRGLKLRQNQVWLMVVITNRFNNPYFYPTIQFAYHQITISQFLQFAPRNSFRASNKSQIMRRNFSRINKFYHSAVQRFNWIWAKMDFDRLFSNFKTGLGHKRFRTPETRTWRNASWSYCKLTTQHLFQFNIVLQLRVKVLQFMRFQKICLF